MFERLATNFINLIFNFRVFDVMETIDDDCDSLGVSFVAVRDRALAAR